ncbi:hypothetical protein D917_08219, partial [Trichinella nativa]
NFSNCTMRRLLIYRLAVFISSLPRDALMKPVKNVLLSAKLSALKCDYFLYIYPESLQTIISRMLMLLRKQTATSFIFGLAALLPDVAIYEKSEAQNGMMKYGSAKLFSRISGRCQTSFERQSFQQF